MLQSGQWLQRKHSKFVLKWKAAAAKLRIGYSYSRPGTGVGSVTVFTALLLFQDSLAFIRNTDGPLPTFIPSIRFISFHAVAMSYMYSTGYAPALPLSPVPLQHTQLFSTQQFSPTSQTGAVSSPTKSIFANPDPHGPLDKDIAEAEKRKA